MLTMSNMVDAVLYVPMLMVFYNVIYLQSKIIKRVAWHGCIV
jgi:hypothetical protein